MHAFPAILSIVLLFSVTACTTSTPPAPGQPTSFFGTNSSTATPSGLVNPAAGQTNPPASSESPAPAPVSSDFTVAAIIDTTTDQVTREQAQAAIDQASKFLREFSPRGLVMADYVEDGSGGSTADMANRYMGTHAAALPNGLVIFSAGDSGQARATGGYGFSVQAPAGFRNRFVSPAAGEAAMYVAVVDYAYKYMACGYSGSDTPSSTTSLAGECRGQSGIPCVPHNGYSMCSNAVGNLYTQNPTYALSSMIVHGLLHNFGPNGDQDHYATPHCNERMGYPAGFFDLQEEEYYNGLCPYVYQDFTDGYRP